MKKLLFHIFIFTSLNCAGQTDYYITGAGGTKLHVFESGSGIPVVLLAGGPGMNPVYLDSVWKQLAVKFRCIVLEQRGTGKSSLSSVDSSTVNMKNYVDDLEALRNHLKLDRITLIGHSWGGMLSMEYAARHPEQAERLILLSPGGPTSKFFTYFGDNIGVRLTDEDKKEKALLDSLKQNNLKGIWPGYFFDRKRALATKPMDSSGLFGQPGVSKYAIRDFVSTEGERVRLLKNYKGPVHIIQGRQDPVGESTVYEIKDVLPQAKVHFIEKCGHMPWFENEAQVKEFYDLIFEALQ